MNKVGDFLTLIKEMPPRQYVSTPIYTLGLRYQIIDINEKGAYYISNDETPKQRRYYTEINQLGEIERNKRIKNECTLWVESHVNIYFVNIGEQRKEKIKNIRKIFDC